MSSMNIDMDEDYASPSSFDPQNLTLRERYRRYGKRSSPSPHNDTYQSKFSNAALYLDNIKNEVEEAGDGDRSARSSSKRRSPSPEMSSVSHSLKVCKVEELEGVVDGGDATFSLFASLFDSALQGLMSIPDLILRLEAACRNVSESINNSCSERHRIVEDRLMRQKARLLLDEAASWSLLWYLYGKGNEEIPEDSIVLPTTSHLDACQFVADDHNAQLCFRLVQWLEGLASKALDLENKVRGSHVGTHLPTSGVWNHTQRFLKKGSMNEKIVQHLDFDASTREHAQPLPDDKRQDESLLEDVWILLRAGRLEEACNLCRAAGQSWRAATLRPFGGMDHTPSVEALIRNGKDRSLQAMELESGINHQRRLWKWASFCASEKIAEQESGKYEAAIYAANCSNVKRILPICTDWETACWALTKSWLDVQVDEELSGGIDSDGAIERSPGQGDLNSQSYLGPESWPLQVKKQQPHDLSALLQKLHSSESVHEAVSRGCKEQHRQIEMSLMMVDIPRLLDLIWSWISPSGNDEDIFRPHGDPQMIRFGAHLVLVLRHLLADDMKDSFREKLMTLGDLILHMYAMFLFSKQHEELVGIYASQLARHRCIDLFVHMMELRLNGSVHVRYKIFLSAIEYLPFSPDFDSNGSFEKGSFEEIIERVLSRSRQVKVGKSDGSSDVTERCRLQSLQKAMVVQWLCFTPPSTITDAIRIGTKLLLRALMHSNVLFREFALISMWRIPALPSGAHTLLSLLAEPLKHLSETLGTEDPDTSDSLREFWDWNEYYSCDATYRSWLQIELENAEVDVSKEEKQRATAVAMETLSSSMALLLRDGNPWLVPTEDEIYDFVELTNLELHATAMLCLPSGECMFPDATLCTSLTSALYSSVSDEVVSSRQLQVNVSISGKDSSSVEVALRCLATENDGFGPNKLADGGILAAVIAAGVKGELARFQTGVTMEIMRVDAWYSGSDGSLGNPATYILRGLSRRCCIPELILRCMQVSVSLMESGNAHESHDELIELVASSETGILNLFSQKKNYTLQDLHNARATFEQARFNLVTALSNVEAKKRFEFLEAVSGTMDAHLRYFKQGYELLHQMEPYINQVLTYAQQSRERSNYEQAALNERMQDYKRQIDRESRWTSSNGSNGSPNGDGIQAIGRSSHKMIEAVMQSASKGKVQTIRQGYLSKRSSNLRGDWKRRFFVLDSRGMLYYYRKQSSKPSGSGGQISAQRNSSELGHGLLSRWLSSNHHHGGGGVHDEKSVAHHTVNLLTSTIKVDADQSDLRFCFRIISPKKNYTLQAESTLDQMDWIEKITGVIASLLSSQVPERCLSGSPMGSSHHRSASDSSSFESSDFDHTAVEEYASERPSYPNPGRLSRISHHLQSAPKPIDVLRRVCGNDKCADCGASDPDWACLNLGILVCIECSGVHRNLGVHISKVRSLTLDVKVWEPSVITLFQSLGNAFANSVWEELLQSKGAYKTELVPTGLYKPDKPQLLFFCKPSHSDSIAVKEKFIHAKYALKVFVRKPKDHNSLVAQHIWEAVGANDKKSVYRLIVNFEADVNHVYEQGSCNSSLTLAKAMLLQEQQIMGDMSGKSSSAVAGTSEGGHGYGTEEFDGCTLLHLACETADVGMIELLLQYGANINVFSSRGQTPLHHCILRGKAACAKLLLTRGADPHAANGAGKTAMELAVESNFRDNEVLNLIADSNG